MMDDPTIFVIVIALVFTSVPVTVAIIQAIQRLHWKVKQDHPGVIIASCGISLLSWGERITIQILPAGIHSEVRVVSELKAQLFDWGKNDRNERDFHQMLFFVLQGR